MEIFQFEGYFTTYFLWGMLAGIARHLNDFRSDSKSPNKLDTQCITVIIFAYVILTIYEKTDHPTAHIIMLYTLYTKYFRWKKNELI